MTTIDYDLSAPRPGVHWRAVVAVAGPFVGLALVVGLFSVLRPRTFATADNAQIVLIQTAVVATAALGMTMVIVSGGIDLSVGSNVALCTVVAATVMSHVGSGVVGLLVSVATGAAAGLGVGGLVTGLKLPPFIVTLGTLGAYRGLATGLARQTTVATADTWLNGLLQQVGPGRRGLVPPGVWVAVALAVFVALALRYTRFGRHVFAVGSNEQTARLCGVPVGRVKVLVYTASGALVGVAAAMQLGYLSVGDPTTATGLELDVIAAVVIGGASLNGGQGSVLGTVVGALIMTTVANGCTKVGLDNWVQQIVTGGIIVAAVTLDRLRQPRAG